MKFILTEEEKNKIKNLHNLNTENVGIISENVLSSILTKLFKGFNKSLAASIENSLKKVIDDVVLKGSGKSISMSALRNNANYKTAIIQAVEEASRAKYKLSFDDLVKSTKYGTNAADDIIKQVDDAVKQELQAAAKVQGKTVAADVRSSEKALTKAQTSVSNAGKKVGGKTVVPATKEELKALTSNWKTNVRLNGKAGSAKNAISKLPTLTRKEIDKIIKSAKTTTGSADNALRGSRGGTKTVKTPSGGFFTETIDKIKKLPGTVTKAVLTKSSVKSLVILVGGVTGIYLLYQALYPNNSIILEDENGDELKEEGNEFATCVQDLIKNKQGQVVTTNTGQVSVLVKSSEYPEGLTFYTNGRVMNLKTKEMGSWSCTLQESSKMSLINILNEQEDNLPNDVNKMINYLDFPVTYNDLVNAKTILKNYSENGRGKEFLDLYQQSGLGSGGLDKTLRNVKTIEPKSVQVKNQISQLYNQIQSGKVTSTNDNTITSSGLDGISITWDKKDGESTSTSTSTSNKPKYDDCSKTPLPHKFGCRSGEIKKLQGCLGLDPKKYQTGNFGPITKKALEDMGITLTNDGITQDIINKICGGQSISGTTNNDVKINFKAPDADTGAPTEIPTNNTQPNQSTQPLSTGGYDLYNNLKNNYTKGIFPHISFEGGRIKYKGVEPKPEELNVLDEFITRNGYTIMKRKDKDYEKEVVGPEVKYVWKKNN